MRAIERCPPVVGLDAMHLATLTHLMDTLSRPIGRSAAHMHADRPHNYRLLQLIRNQRMFDASILFYGYRKINQKEEKSN